MRYLCSICLYYKTLQYTDPIEHHTLYIYTYHVAHTHHYAPRTKPGTGTLTTRERERKRAGAGAAQRERGYRREARQLAGLPTSDWDGFHFGGLLPHPLLPSATSFGPNTGTAQPQLTRHAPPHTLQVLRFKDGPGLRVLVLAACCFLAYIHTPPPAWHARLLPDRFAYRSASTRRILHY